MNLPNLVWSLIYHSQYRAALLAITASMTMRATARVMMITYTTAILPAFSLSLDHPASTKVMSTVKALF